MSPLESALSRHTNAEVRFDQPTRLIYSTDASNYQVMPLGVVLPRTAEDVVATVALCAEHHIAITPRGGGSSLCGSAIGPGVVIDFTKYMDALLEVDTATRKARVQPGLILGQLNKQLAPMGLWFGPDPASAERAAIGGVIGNNATGAHSIVYGMSADNVAAVQAALADGSLAQFGSGQEDKTTRKQGDMENHLVSLPAGHLVNRVRQIAHTYQSAIRRDFPKVWRRASGYNLDFIAEMLAYDPANQLACLIPANTKRLGSNLENHVRQISRFNLAPLFAGAEGTLGVLTEVTLHLAPKPKHTALVVTSFDDLLESMRAVPALLSTGPSALELIGGMFIDLARDLPECTQRMGWVDLSRGVPEGLLVIEYAGDDVAAVNDGVARLQHLVAQEHLPCTLTPLRDAKSQADVWHVRKQGLTVLTSIRSAFKPISVVEDVAVPVEHLPEYVERLRAIFKDNGTDGAFYAHASAGVLHVRPLVNLKTHEGMRIMQDIGQRALALCRNLGGAMSGEHGDGYERSHQNEALFGQEVYRAFCELKDTFDPRGLLNPGKKVRGQNMDDHMRLGPNYKTRSMPTTFRFALDGSFAGTVEQCNGSGVCRKLDGGVMCPSYRATREEMHSTRGRANLLREFLKAGGVGKAESGGISHPTSPSTLHVKEALDLCLSCKACATECAAGVDMSKLKSEFVAHIYEEQGTLLRAWLLGRIGQFGAMACAVAPLSNWLLQQGWAKSALGLAPERTLPRFASTTFEAWWQRRKTRGTQQKASNVKRQVALFVDTFSRYNHPEVAIAAVELLERAGYDVTVPPWKCCGRPLLSQGQPKAALELATFNVAQLAPLARQGIPILGLEPSCVSALKDDYLDLLPGEESKAVAAMTTAVEGFTVSNFGFSIDEAQSKIENQKPKILLHGHCHQKALGAAQGTKQALIRVGYDVTEIDATCCGMAGAFGYEAEHYALSQQIGELSLLPTVRNADKDAIIVAPGTSCREQIQHFTQRTVLHPVQVLAKIFDSQDLS
jgi:FAD/FMN-containing dehydrogenase/Fe-S oxidoreductase